MQDLELSAAHAAQVHRFVARRVSNHADAADIAQQALMIACEKSNSFRGANTSAWLLTIARNLIVDHYRARGRVQFVGVDNVVESEPALRTPPDAVGATFDSRARMSGWLECITRTLRLEEQIAVLLADLYGYRDKEAAPELRMSVPSFKLLLHGARARLKEVAGDHCALVCRDTTVGCSCDQRRPGTMHRVGVVCPLDARALVALRGRLLGGIEVGSDRPRGQGLFASTRVAGRVERRTRPRETQMG